VKTEGKQKHGRCNCDALSQTCAGPYRKERKKGVGFPRNESTGGQTPKKKKSQGAAGPHKAMYRKSSDSSSWKSSETGTDWEKRNNMRNRQVSRTRHCRVYTLCGQVSEREFPIEHEVKVEGDQTDPEKTGGKIKSESVHGKPRLHGG